MSIAVAVRKGGHIELATDSMTSMGPERVPVENRADCKFVQIGNAFLATTGWTLYSNILEDLLARRRGTPRLTDERAIFRFFNELWHVLHERYSFVKDQPGGDDEGSPFGSLDSSFLVVAPTGLFSVATDLSVMRFERYFAIGSGAHAAMGACHALYEGEATAADVARSAVAAAIAHDIYCGPPINGVGVRERRPRTRASGATGGAKRGR